jgi:hypothetical protein
VWYGWSIGMCLAFKMSGKADARKDRMAEFLWFIVGWFLFYMCLTRAIPS